MLKRTWILCGLAVTLGLGAGDARAQFLTLNDGGSHVVDFFTTDWYQVTDTGCTSFCWPPNGTPTHLIVNAGADMQQDVEIFGASTITVNDGVPYDINVWDEAHATIHGGTISNLDLEVYADATITGGWTWFLRAHGYGNTTISGGEVDIIELADTHALEMTGGDSSGVYLNDSSTFLWRGGDIGQQHGAGNNSHTQIVGSDFKVDQVRVSYGIIQATEGDLSGNLELGNPYGIPDWYLIPGFKHNSTAPFTGTIELVAGSDDPDEDWLGSDAELNAGTNPNLYDTDGDGLGDGEEVGPIGSSPLLVDSDSDGYDDPTEVAAGSDPMNANSTPPNPPTVPSLSGPGLAGLALVLCLASLATPTSRSQRQGR